MTPEPDADGRYVEGTEVQLEARLNLAHAAFVGWERDTSGTNPVTTVTVDRDLEVVAVFIHIGTPTPTTAPVEATLAPTARPATGPAGRPDPNPHCHTSAHQYASAHCHTYASDTDPVEANIGRRRS